MDVVKCSIGRPAGMRATAALVAAALSLQACAPLPTVPGGAKQARTYDPCIDQTARQVGALAGALIGGVIAKHVSDSKNAVPVGLVLGALIGNAIGKDVAKRQCDVYLVAKRNNLELLAVSLKMPASQQAGSQEVVGLSATLIEGEGATGHFLPGSDQLTPDARRYFSEIAAAYLPAARKTGLAAQEAALIDSSKVLIVGHTDDQEDSNKAAELSERRAKAVAAVFRSAGVPESSVYYQGAGETLPIADNGADSGRARNRRVEIVDVANDRVLEAYLGSRVSTSAYFRPVPAASQPALAQANIAKDTPPAAVPKQRRKTRAPAQAIATPPVARLAQSAQDGAAPGRIDFGGVQFQRETHAVNIGEPVHSYGFSILPLAIADELPVRSCIEDRPRVSRSVKALRDASEYRVGEFQPGAYGTSWVGKANGHLVAMNNVAVVRAGGLPAANPNVLIFKNFDPKGGAARKPDYASTASVNTYAGSTGTLYRVFLEKGAPLRCIDVVLPSAAPFRARQGFVYQERNHRTFAIDFKPEVPSRKL